MRAVKLVPDFHDLFCNRFFSKLTSSRKQDDLGESLAPLCYKSYIGEFIFVTEVRAIQAQVCNGSRALTISVHTRSRRFSSTSQQNPLKSRDQTKTHTKIPAEKPLHCKQIQEQETFTKSTENADLIVLVSLA